MTKLTTFLSQNRSILVASSVGAVLLASVSHPLFAETAQHRAELITEGTWTVTERLAALVEGRTSHQELLASAAPFVDAPEIEEISEALDDKRSRLEGALRELENLERMVEVAQTLEANERDEAVTAALLIYNEAVSGAEFDVGVNLTSDRATTAFQKAESSTDLLKRLHPLQGQ